MPKSELAFGTRKCLICRRDFQAPVFGRHVVNDHSAEEIEQGWPGGTRGFLVSLQRSLTESIRVARKAGREDVVADLQRSQTALEAVLRADA